MIRWGWGGGGGGNFSTSVNDVHYELQNSSTEVQRNYLALINRAGGLYGRILTEVVSTDRTQ